MPTYRRKPADSVTWEGTGTKSGHGYVQAMERAAEDSQNTLVNGLVQKGYTASLAAEKAAVGVCKLQESAFIENTKKKFLLSSGSLTKLELPDIDTLENVVMTLNPKVTLSPFKENDDVVIYQPLYEGWGNPPGSDARVDLKSRGNRSVIISSDGDRPMENFTEAFGRGAQKWWASIFWSIKKSPITSIKAEHVVWAVQGLTDGILRSSCSIDTDSLGDDKLEQLNRLKQVSCEFTDWAFKWNRPDGDVGLKKLVYTVTGIDPKTQSKSKFICTNTNVALKLSGRNQDKELIARIEQEEADTRDTKDSEGDDKNPTDAESSKSGSGMEEGGVGIQTSVHTVKGSDPDTQSESEFIRNNTDLGLRLKGSNQSREDIDMTAEEGTASSVSKGSKRHRETSEELHGTIEYYPDPHSKTFVGQWIIPGTSSKDS